MDEDNKTINMKIFQENKIISKPMTEIIKEMVGSQIPISFEIEAIKAQAIIARTYIVRKSRLFGGDGCTKYKNIDLCTDGHCGNWLTVSQLKEKWGNDFDYNWRKISKAVEETKDLIMTIKNKPIEPRYNCTCGGSTENSENIDGNRTVYLRKVLCDYCVDSPYYKESIEMSLEDIEKKLQIATEKITPTKGLCVEGMIEDVVRDEEGRIISLKLGGKVFKGTEVMSMLGLNSTRFGWKPTGFKIEMQGKGDGLGLCQFGANAMAKQGKTVEEILKYYFTGIKIKELEKPSINQPLCGKIIVIDPGHGGDNTEDVVGPSGIREKDINLAISLELAKLLRDAGATVYETRTKDIYVSLSKRVNLADQVRPDFFISIHQNFFANPNISGSEIYYYRGDIESETLANLILQDLSQNLGTTSRGAKIADFYLLREVRTSALQIEVGFITNPDEEKRMAEPDFPSKVAKAISQGLKRYYSYE